VVPVENKITFGGSRWPVKIAQFFAVISIYGTENLETTKNYSALFSVATHRLPKILLTQFRRFFPSHRKLLCTRGSTHLHFNFTPVLNWKITHIHIIIHNNLIH
jgi:hypothetical protein